MADNSGFGGWLSRRLKSTAWGTAGLFFIVGIVFWGGFNTAMESTNTLGFCISCHEMEDTVYEEYRETIHYQNRTGVRATCSDCHVPDPWVHKVVRKIQATKELYHKFMGTIDTPNKFEAKRFELAKRVWASMKETDSRECRNCHNFNSMSEKKQKRRAWKQHENARAEGQTCIDCHKGIAHKPVHHLLEEEEETAESEQPAEEPKDEAPAKTAAVAPAKPAAEEAEAEAPKTEAAPARQAAAPAPAPAAPAASSGGGAIDWSKVQPVKMTLLYPGQTSWEWILTGKDHGGARAFKKGDRCSECHRGEEADMGAKIVGGEKAEATPIPGKRPAVPVDVQAAHDGTNVYFRFQWPDTPHTPVPFADGGKMDPDNQTKLALMIIGEGVDKGELAGCWATCHHDSRYMPHAPDAAKLGAAGDVTARIDTSDGITKYLPDSRTKIEVRGRNKKPKGGWDKLKDQAEVDGLLGAGAYTDLLRFRSGGQASNGHIAEQRIETGGAELTATGTLADGVWTVEMSRPLKPGTPGDIDLEAGKVYTIGVAVHDDYTTARFHHVSLEYRFALDSAEAELNAAKQ